MTSLKLHRQIIMLILERLPKYTFQHEEHILQLLCVLGKLQQREGMLENEENIAGKHQLQMVAV